MCVVADIRRGLVMDVFDEIREERRSQDKQWGIQNHPDCMGQYKNYPKALADHHSIPSADTARQQCEFAFKFNRGTWTDIFVEEVAEVIDAITDTKHLREELIQVAAVSTAWIEAIDRRNEELG
jgi:hypothetical protein